MFGANPRGCARRGVVMAKTDSCITPAYSVQSLGKFQRGHVTRYNPPATAGKIALCDTSLTRLTEALSCGEYQPFVYQSAALAMCNIQLFVRQAQ